MASATLPRDASDTGLISNKKMTMPEAAKLLSREERFMGTVAAMNTLLIAKGVYTQEEFDSILYDGPRLNLISRKNPALVGVLGSWPFLVCDISPPGMFAITLSTLTVLMRAKFTHTANHIARRCRLHRALLFSLFHFSLWSEDRRALSWKNLFIPSKLAYQPRIRMSLSQIWTHTSTPNFHFKLTGR